jgi:hypothetical protein
MTRRLLVSLPVVCLLSGSALLWAEDSGHDNRRTFQTANMIELIVGVPAAGAATLFRSKNRLEMSVAITELAVNSAYTVWWVIFNNPANCDGPCDQTDLGTPAVRASVVYAAGFITAPALDTGHATASLDAGALPEGVDVAAGTVRGLKRGRGLRAEVHIMIRHQDVLNKGHVHEQIGSLIDAWDSTQARNWFSAVFMPVNVAPR